METATGTIGEAFNHHCGGVIYPRYRGSFWRPWKMWYQERCEKCRKVIFEVEVR